MSQIDGANTGALYVSGSEAVMSFAQYPLGSVKLTGTTVGIVGVQIVGRKGKFGNHVRRRGCCRGIFSVRRTDQVGSGAARRAEAAGAGVLGT